MNKTTDKDMKALDASMESLKNKAGVEHLKGPFTAGLVYSGLNCGADHRQAVQEAYNSLPAIVRAAFERTGFHIEGCGSNIDMASRLDCEPPALALGVTNYEDKLVMLALGVTNYEDKLVMIAEYSFGQTGKGIVVGTGAVMSPLNTTIAHEIGHVLDWSAPEQGSRGKGFVLALVSDLESAIKLTKTDANSFRLQTIAANAPQPIEVFAESFANAIGFGGTARGGDFAACFPKSVEYVRGWFERNYDKFEVRAAA